MTPHEPHASDSRPRARRPLQDAPEPPTELATALAPPPRRVRPVLEIVLLASTAALLAAVAWPIATAGLGAPPSANPPSVDASPTAVSAVATPTETPIIQIALLLDTSSSMDGLLDQARSQLWRVVNALDSAMYHGAAPRLEIALYEYGNDTLEGQDGFIRQVSGFTVELDRVSEALFALETLGGDEYAGQVIARSLDELTWNDGPGTLKVMYIAGNESFDQGPVDWKHAIERARAKGVVVNTVLCNGADDHWSAAALLSGGRFMQIDHDAVAQYIPAPQDDAIARLGLAINETAVPYGSDGLRGLGNQLRQDSNAEGYGRSASVQRALTKGSRNFTNPTWDLLDVTTNPDFKIESLAPDALPEALRSKSRSELESWLADKRVERAALKGRLTELAKARATFIAAERERRDGAGHSRLDTAIVSSIVEQARAAGFTIGSDA